MNFLDNKCLKYCSKYEFEQRYKLKDVHILESTESTCLLPPSKRILDPERAVGKFYRNADLTNKGNNRDIECLTRTAQYLISNIWFPCARRITNKFENIENLDLYYSFCFDRYAAVRQEIVQCNFTSDRSRENLNIAVLFYVNSLHSICIAKKNSQKLDFFDRKLHEQALTVVLAKLSNIGDSIDIIECNDGSDRLYLLVLLMTKIGLYLSSFRFEENNNRSSVPLTLEIYQLFATLNKTSRLVTTASSIYEGLEKFVRELIDYLCCGCPGKIFDSWRSLEPVLYSARAENRVNMCIQYTVGCLYCMFIVPFIRLWRLQLLYSSSNNKAANVFPLELLRKKLKFSNEQSTEEFCRFCGFNVVKDGSLDLSVWRGGGSIVGSAGYPEKFEIANFTGENVSIEWFGLCSVEELSSIVIDYDTYL